MMKTLFIKGVEFFNYLTAIGLKGLMLPFTDTRYPALTVSHPFPGKISVSTENGGTITMSDTDTLRLEPDGTMSVVNGPSHYTNKWRKLVATTSLAKSVLEFSKDPVFIPYGCMALVYDSNRSVTDREAIMYHQPGRMIYGYELIILFDRNDRIETFFVRAEKSVNALKRLEKFVDEHELIQPESGAFNHIREDAKKQFEAKVEAGQKKSARDREFWGLIEKIKTPTPMVLELNGKKMTVRDGVIYPGLKVGGRKIDRETAFDSGLLHQVAAEVSRKLEVNAR